MSWDVAVVGTRGQHYYEEIIEEDLLPQPATEKAS
jgi:hypothetical protein